MIRLARIPTPTIGIALAVSSSAGQRAVFRRACSALPSKWHATKQARAHGRQPTDAVAGMGAVLGLVPFGRIALAHKFLPALQARLRRIFACGVGALSRFAPSALAVCGSVRRGVRERDGSISRLLDHAGPAAIFRRIRAVIVDAVDGITRWAFSHVGNEIGEGAPPLANRDSATAVMFPARLFRVHASLPHRRPHDIQRMPSVVSKRESMRNCAHFIMVNDL